MSVGVRFLVKNEAERWIDIGARIAVEHKEAILWLAKERPELTVEQLLDAHIVWLAGKFMTARHDLLVDGGPR